MGNIESRPETDRLEPNMKRDPRILSEHNIPITAAQTGRPLIIQYRVWKSKHDKELKDTIS